MEKIVRNILISLISILVLSGCTQSAGHIGGWFGQWKVTSIAIDGKEDASYKGNMFWSFHSDIIKMQGGGESYGTWEEKDNTLILNFSYGDNVAGEGSGRYSPLPASHLPVGISRLEILKKPGSEMTLRYNSDDGKSFVYKLKKWW